MMMVQTRRPQAPPRTNLAPLGVVIAVVGAVAVSFLRLPGFVLLWLGMWMAALLAAEPSLLTGKKDAAGKSTAGNVDEEQKQNRFQMWKALRWRLIVPNADWLPNDAGTRSPRIGSMQEPLWKRALLAAGWLLLPQQFGSIAAVAAGAVAFTFPPDQLILMGVLEGSWLVPLAALNAVGMYVTIRQLEVARRRYLYPTDPKPPVTVFEVRRVARWWIGAAAAAGGGVLAAVAVAIILNVLGWWWLFWPVAVTVAGSGVLVAAVILRKSWSSPLLDEWENTSRARAEWVERWATRRITPPPHLISSTQLGDPSTPIIVDRFEARAPFDAAQAVRDPEKFADRGGVRVSVLFEENVDSSGEPVPGTKHPLRFQVVAAPVDAFVDITDPTVDEELVKLMWRCAIADAAHTMAVVQPMPLSFTALHVPDAPESDDGATSAAAWAIQYPPGEAMSFPPLTDTVSSQLRIDMIPTETALVYAGALDGEDTRTVWVNEEMPGELHRQRIEARWQLRWKDVLKMGEQPPFIEHTAYETGTLPTGEVIESQPFLLPEGQEPVRYLTAEKRDKLTSALQNPGWVSVASWQHWLEGGRAGERHQGAIVVRWSPSPLPKNPARIRPARVGTDTETVRHVLEAAINDGFDSAKLARPELIETRALTTPRSEEHIWDLTLRLYGGVTLADVKRVAERIRQGMGACAWLRVTGNENGCRVVAGANPLIGDVTFAGPGAEKECVRLNWEQAFTDTNVVSYSTGQTPELLTVNQLPKNPKVKELIFRIPPGSGLSIGSISGARKKLLPATGNMWMDVSQGEKADLVRVLVCAEFPLPFPAPVDWDELYNSTAVPFAASTSGEPIVFDWVEDPHLILLGRTGSGKSAAAMNLINGAIIRGCEILIADPQKFGADFRYALPWVRGMALTVLEASAMMEWVYAEVKRRKKLNGDYGVPSYMDLPEAVRPRHMVVFIDEFTSLMAVSRMMKLPSNASQEQLEKYAVEEADNEARRNIGFLSTRLVQEARSSGVTLLLAGQELKKDTLQNIPGGTSLKSSSSSLLLGKSSFGSLQSALKDPLDVPDLGDTVPKGRGLFESSSRAAQVVQMWFDAPDHGASSVEHIAAVRDPLADAEKLDLAAMVSQTATGTSVHGRLLDEDRSGEVREPTVPAPDENNEVLPTLTFDLDLDDIPDEPSPIDDVLPTLVPDITETSELTPTGDDDVDLEPEPADEPAYDEPAPQRSEPLPAAGSQPSAGPLVQDQIVLDTARTGQVSAASEGPVVFTADRVDLPGAVPVTPIAKTPEPVTRIMAVDRILTWLRSNPHVREAVWVTGAWRTHGRVATDAAANVGVTLKVYAPGFYPPGPDADDD